MAAITPYIEQQAEEAPEPTSAGLGRGPRIKSGLDSTESQTKNLTNLVWTRYAMEEALKGVGFHVEKDRNAFFLVLDKPLDINVVPWQAFPQPARRSALLSWTKKMGTWSFSLPAGSQLIGGTCPAATAAQPVLKAEDRRKSLAVLRQTVGEVESQAAICSSCYATGGNYRLGTQQFRQLLAFSWVKQSYTTGEFVEVMSEAVKLANYRTGGGTEVGIRYPAERDRGLGIRAYFRIHDSGDFFDANYYDAWVQIARRNPDIRFWAPTRMWVFPGFQRHAASNRATNLVLRPSAYHVGDASPHIGGWDGGSTSLVFADDEGMGDREEILPERVRNTGPGDDRYSWRCQAYAVLDEAHSCRHAIAPDGQTGCRACWVETKEDVNYVLH